MDAGTVDAFTPGDVPGEAVMFVFDHLDWDDPGEHLKLLQDKINAYLGFIESGQYKQFAPGQRYHRFIIRVMSMFPPPDVVDGFVKVATAQMAPFGVSLEFQQAS